MEWLVDADSIIYKAGSIKKCFISKQSSNGLYIMSDNKDNVLDGKVYETYFYEPFEFTKQRVKAILKSIETSPLFNKDTDKISLHLTGNSKNNKKLELYPYYKSNRMLARPVWYKQTVLFMQEEYNATVHETEEADDAVVRLHFKDVENTRICTIDKDILRMVPGRHYNYNTGLIITTTEQQAARNFACFTLSGDASDNIPGIPGFGELKWESKTNDGIEDIGDYKSKHKALKYVKSYYNNAYLESLQSSLIDAAEIWIKYNEDLDSFKRNIQLLWLPVKGLDRCPYEDLQCII
jgi:hypothetical protein